MSSKFNKKKSISDGEQRLDLYPSEADLKKMGNIEANAYMTNAKMSDGIALSLQQKSGFDALMQNNIESQNRLIALLQSQIPANDKVNEAERMLAMIVDKMRSVKSAATKPSEYQAINNNAHHLLSMISETDPATMDHDKIKPHVKSIVNDIYSAMLNDPQGRVIEYLRQMLKDQGPKDAPIIKPLPPPASASASPTPPAYKPYVYDSAPYVYDFTGPEPAHYMHKPGSTPRGSVDFKSANSSMNPSASASPFSTSIVQRPMPSHKAEEVRASESSAWNIFKKINPFSKPIASAPKFGYMDEDDDELLPGPDIAQVAPGSKLKTIGMDPPEVAPVAVKKELLAVAPVAVKPEGDTVENNRFLTFLLKMSNSSEKGKNLQKLSDFVKKNPDLSKGYSETYKNSHPESIAEFTGESIDTAKQYLEALGHIYTWTRADPLKASPAKDEVKQEENEDDKRPAAISAAEAQANAEIIRQAQGNNYMLSDAEIAALRGQNRKMIAVDFKHDWKQKNNALPFRKTDAVDYLSQIGEIKGIGASKLQERLNKIIVNEDGDDAKRVFVDYGILIKFPKGLPAKIGVKQEVIEDVKPPSANVEVKREIIEEDEPPAAISADEQTRENAAIIRRAELLYGLTESEIAKLANLNKMIEVDYNANYGKPKVIPFTKADTTNFLEKIGTIKGMGPSNLQSAMNKIVADKNKEAAKKLFEDHGILINLRETGSGLSEFNTRQVTKTTYHTADEKWLQNLNNRLREKENEIVKAEREQRIQPLERQSAYQQNIDELKRQRDRIQTELKKPVVVSRETQEERVVPTVAGVLHDVIAKPVGHVLKTAFNRTVQVSDRLNNELHDGAKTVVKDLYGFLRENNFGVGLLKGLKGLSSKEELENIATRTRPRDEDEEYDIVKKTKTEAPPATPEKIVTPVKRGRKLDWQKK